jgi:hypothetical protein
VPVQPSAASITASKILLVEGKDEVQFFEALLNHLHLKSVQIREIGGVYKFPTEFATFLVDPGFSQLNAYAIIRDADKSRTSAFQSVKGVLAKHNQPCPRKHAQFASSGALKVGVFIMPGNTTGSMLEDLCLQTVADDEAMACVNDFIHCLKTQAKCSPKNESKAKVQAFLAAMPDTVNSLGVGAQKGYWQLHHPALTELRSFLTELAT